MIDRPIHVIGGGLAGTEAAWQIAQAGIPVILYEMRPIRSSPAHHSQFLAELVCSNSFGAMAVDRATGLLHEELRRLNSLVIAQADQHSVPAGGALAVDRGVFSRNLTEILANHPLVTLKRQEITEIPRDGIVVLTTGPLTSAALAADLQNFAGLDYLSFFDAASPIILGESIDRSIAFLASRYDKGEAAYLNCPMDREQYLHFWQELKQAEQAELKDFERENAKFFEACLPIEELASRGEDTMRFGPLKPVGLADPRYPDQRPYAVIQLRMEDKAGQLWNMVGFQTNLKWGELTRVFRLIPGLEKAEFVRIAVQPALSQTQIGQLNLSGGAFRFHTVHLGGTSLAQVAGVLRHHFITIGDDGFQGLCVGHRLNLTEFELRRCFAHLGPTQHFERTDVTPANVKFERLDRKLGRRGVGMVVVVQLFTANDDAPRRNVG